MIKFKKFNHEKDKRNLYMVEIVIAAVLSFSILSVYTKTRHVLGAAWVWAIMVAVLSLLFHGFSYKLLAVPISFFLGWSIFTLATYVEDTFLLKAIVLAFTMFLIALTLISVQ